MHMHTYRSPDCVLTPDIIIAVCLRRNIEGIAVTDHNTIKGALELSRLAPFPVIVGEEIKTAEGEVIGYFLEEEIPSGLGIEDTISRIKDQRGVVCIPHPFDRVRKSRVKLPVLNRVIKDVDIIETFNSRNLFESSNTMALEYARRHEKLICVGSDAHLQGEIGASITYIESFQNSAEFKKALAKATFSFHKSNFLVHVYTKAVKSWKVR